MIVRLYVSCMGLGKSMSEVLIMPARHSRFVKATRDLDVLPPTHGT